MQNNFTSLNGSIHSLFNQSFSFKHLAALVASVLVILCAVWLPYALFWQLDGLLSLQQAQILGSCMFYGGIASFVAIAVVTRFRLSKDWSLKRNVGLFSILLLTTLVFSSLLSAPVVAALTPLPSDTGPNNSSAFKFSVPFTEYQWVVAQFRDGTYYAINGSDWNIMTIVEPWQPVAPWAALAENKTALVEQVLSVTDPGKVLLNELSFDYALTVPENVTVVESLNGLTRSFINSANSQGSPYTVSVDTVNPTYYLAQDSADRYIDEWSSLDAIRLIQTVADSMTQGSITLANGTYTGASGTTLYWRSNINLMCDSSATLVLNTNKNGFYDVTVVFNNTVNTNWENVNVIAAGTGYTDVNVIRIFNVSYSNTFTNCNFTNTVTGGTGADGLCTDDYASPVFNRCNFYGSVSSSIQGLYCIGYSTPTFINCNFGSLGVGKTNVRGAWVGENASPTFDTCNFNGGINGTGCTGLDAWTLGTITANDCNFNGDGSTNSRGVILTNVGNNSLFQGCNFYGGNGGTSGHGLIAYEATTAKFQACNFYGGSTGTCFGATIWGYATPDFIGCAFVGGNGGAGCYGINIGAAAAPTFHNCEFIGGQNGTGSHNIYITDSAAPSFQSCSSINKRYSANFTYTSNDSGRFLPFADKPYVQISMVVNVVSATAGVTLNIGSTASGNDIASGISLASTGTKVVNLTKVGIAADGYMYATPSGAAADGSFQIWYVVTVNFANCNSLYLQSSGAVKISTSTFSSNAATSSVLIAGNAVSSLNWRITNCQIETLAPASLYSVTSGTAISNAPIYNCVLIGAVNNITPAAGTASGTNTIV